MALPVARIWGDPLVDGGSGSVLRELVDLAFAAGISVELCWSGVKGLSRGLQVTIPDGDGGQHRLFSNLGKDDLDRLLCRTGATVPASSPLLVFGSGEDVFQASLEFVDACVVIACEGCMAKDILSQLLQVCETVAVTSERHVLPADTMDACLRVPPLDHGDIGILHDAGDGNDPGSDVLLRCLHDLSWPAHLRFVLTGASSAMAERWRQRLMGLADVRCEVLLGPVCPEHFARCVAMVQPSAIDANYLPWSMAMASGRVLVAGRHAASARQIRAPGICIPLGGRMVDGKFLVDPRLLRCALDRVSTGDPETRAEIESIAGRARSWALMHLDARQPAPRGPARSGKRRPLVVLEAPMLERSSSSILTLETALALQRSARVDLRLCPSVPFKHGLGVFTERYPSLLSCLSRPPEGAEVWIRSGWPVLHSRPDTDCFVVRIDWEYGAIPTELTPLVTEEADRVIVHSRAVRRALMAAGSTPQRIIRIPHGVDARTFHPEAKALSQVVEFKGDLLAVLFVGELIWRKGFDLWIKTLLALAKRGLPICGVVKAPGGDSNYRGFEMRALIDRCREKAPYLKILTIETELSDVQMAELYCASDLLLHPYRGEGFGMPVLEAAACGLPVLTTAGGSTDDFCDPAEGIPSARRYVDLPGSHEGRPYVLEPDASKCVEILASRLAQVVDLRANCIARSDAVRARHTWQKAANAIEQLAFDAPTLIPRTCAGKVKLPMARGSQAVGSK